MTNFSNVEKLINSKSRQFLERFHVSTFFGELPRRIKYMISSKVNFARRIGPVKREKDNLLWNIQFSHAIIGDVNLGSVLSCAEVKRNLPTDLKGKFNVRLWFRYGKTIGCGILNYNKHLRHCGDLY